MGGPGRPSAPAPEVQIGYGLVRSWSGTLVWTCWPLCLAGRLRYLRRNRSVGLSCLYVWRRRPLLAPAGVFVLVKKDQTVRTAVTDAVPSRVLTVVSTRTPALVRRVDIRSARQLAVIMSRLPCGE